MVEFTSEMSPSKKELPTINLATTKALPSKFILYPKDASIKYRPYSFGEIKSISQSKMTITEQLEKVLSGVECNFDKKRLTLSDLLYLGLLRKISTLGTTKFIINYVCGECRSQIRRTISSDDLEFKDLEIPDFPVIADLSIGEYHFNPLTVEDFYRLHELGKSQDTIAALAMQCSNKSFEEAYKAFYNCTNMNDAQLLNEVDKVLDHGLKPITVKCTNSADGKTCGCSHENVIALDGDGGKSELILTPFRESEGSSRNRIRFGNKGNS